MTLEKRVLLVKLKNNNERIYKDYYYFNLFDIFYFYYLMFNLYFIDK